MELLATWTLFSKHCSWRPNFVTVFTSGLIIKKYTPNKQTVSSINYKNCLRNYKPLSPINSPPSNWLKVSNGKMKKHKCNKTSKSLTDCSSKPFKNHSPLKVSIIFIKTLSKIISKVNLFITPNVISAIINLQGSKISKISL